jgi:EmrB/QacA subfamily drug resistance transporter
MATPTPTATAPGPPRAASDTRWLALTVIAVAQLMVALDATIVNIALPSAQADLGFADGARAWVVTAYTCALAGLLLLGGRIADRIGRRRAFLVGLAGFALASGFSGLAPDFGWLIAGRAAQGAFAALLTPTALSLIAVTFTTPRDRARAFGVYGAVASSGAAVGLLLGGVLTEFAGWRWCLYVNIGIAGFAYLTGRAVLPAQDGYPRTRVDAVSGGLVTGGIVAVVLACSQAAGHGWGSLRVLAPAAVGVTAVVAFLWRQARAAEPLLPLELLTDRRRAGAYLSAAVAVVGAFGMFLLLTYHFQVVLGWSPVRAGVAFLPLSVAVSVSAYALGSRLLPRVAPGALIVPGLLTAAAGLGVLSTLAPSSGYLFPILPAELLLGTGMGLVMTPAISVATSGVEPRHAGIAAAVATTAMQVGGSVGTAVLNSVAVAATTRYGTAHGSSATAVVHGFGMATTVSAVALLGTAAVAAALLRTPARTRKQVVR